MEASLYLPPVSNPKLSSLVLLHGQGGDQYQWLHNVLLDNYLDNLLHRGLIKPFMVLMPSLAPHQQSPGLVTFLARELPAWLDTRPYAMAGAASRALAGFSRGGSLTLRVAAAHPQTYAMWAPVAGWIPPKRLTAARLGLLQSRRLVLYCGKQDRVAGFNRDLASALRLAGAAVEHVERLEGHTFRLLHAITPHLLERVSAALYQHGQHPRQL